MARAETHLHVCAHLGDDLRYLTPNLWQSVEAGARVVVIYLTDTAACSADGRTYGPAAVAPFEGARTLRAAYAQLAGAAPDAQWTEHGPGVVGLANIRLVCLGLREDAAADPDRTLDGLWRERTERLDGPSGAVSRKQLVAALAGLAAEYEPCLVRVADPDAEHLGFDDEGRWIRSDDAAHIAGALFALAALEQDHGDPRRTPAVVESYRGQTGRRWPFALDRETRQRRACLLAAGSQDVVLDGETPPDLRSAAPRFAHSTRWLTLDGRGRLLAAAVVGGRPRVWTQRAAGAAGWTLDAEPIGPARDFGDTRRFGRDSGADRLAPSIEAVTALDGRVHLFAQRLRLGVFDDEHSREALTAFQDAPGGRFRPWEVLGGPNGNTDRDGMRRRVAGPPHAVALADGGVQFFLRNYGSGISSRRRVFGHGWGPWLDFGGDGQDGQCAFTAADGRVHLVAPGDESIRSWVQDGPAGDFARDTAVSTPVTGGPVTALDLGDGRFAVLTRSPGTAAVIAYVQPLGGPWAADRVAELGEPGGYGPIAAAVAADGRVALATRGRSGTVAYAWWDPRDGAAPMASTWAETGPLLVQAPALALDGAGRMVLVALSTDGSLHAAVLDQGPAPALVQMGRV